MKKSLLVVSLLTVLNGCQTTSNAERIRAFADRLPEPVPCTTDFNFSNNNESAIYSCDDNQVSYIRTDAEKEPLEFLAKLWDTAAVRWCDDNKRPSVYATFQDNKGNYVHREYFSNAELCDDEQKMQRTNRELVKLERRITEMNCQTLADRGEVHVGDFPYGTKSIQVQCDRTRFVSVFRLTHPALKDVSSNNYLKENAASLLLDDNDIKSNCKMMKKNMGAELKEAGVIYSGSIIYSNTGAIVAEKYIDLETCE